MMTQTREQATLSLEECAVLDELIEGWYRQALHVMRTAHQHGIALPAGLPSPDAYRALVSR